VARRTAGTIPKTSCEEHQLDSRLEAKAPDRAEAALLKEGDERLVLGVPAIPDGRVATK
jgi:hypothetical protein